MPGDRVLVTGASGYIALHVVQQLQQEGYKVRGTVRSLKNEEKVAPIRQLCPDAAHPLELVEADLLKEEGWSEAVQGCQYVIHVASPFPVDIPDDPDEIIKPAVNGTLFVLQACKKVGGVKRVVLTSSIAAVTDGRVSQNFSEEDWQNPENTPLPYYKSKPMAEKAAWDFVDELPDDAKFELSVINPGYVMGPVLTKSWATSMIFPKRIMQKEMPALPKVSYGMVDVRDVALAHIRAMTIPEAAGQRHLLVGENLWIKDMAEILDAEFKSMGYKVPLKEAPLFVMKMVALMDKSVNVILPIWGVQATFDNTRMKTVLKIEPRPIKDSIIEMAYSMIKAGFIKKTEQYIKAKEGQK